MEFRCFVVGGQLTAISQYRHLIHFPRLVANWDAGAGLFERIVQAFETDIGPKLTGLFPSDDCIVDLAIELAPTETISSIMSAELIPPSSVVKVWVVEANPFFETTDGCLFSWERDYELIMGDARLEATPTSRLTRGPKKGAASLIYEAWRSVMLAPVAT